MIAVWSYSQTSLTRTSITRILEKTSTTRTKSSGNSVKLSYNFYSITQNFSNSKFFLWIIVIRVRKRGIDNEAHISVLQISQANAVFFTKRKVF